MPKEEYPTRSQTYGEPRDTLSLRPLTKNKLALMLFKQSWLQTYGEKLYDEVVLFTHLKKSNREYRKILKQVEKMTPLEVKEQLKQLKEQAKKGTTTNESK